MRKRITASLIAILASGSIALGLSSFKQGNSAKEDVLMYWYLRTGVNTYVFDRQAETPTPGCENGTEICAKGFISPQTPSSINDLTPANTKKKN